ncbi:hypothetical protein MPL1_10818 [Methylophaga lonarensis MPL]|uniref:Dual-action ribosomal maturation protein DarP n=1 Tax=Methylophaga lonarensis MPL TaxID=1286106 RepID=M7NU85_9GAMM|nr:ribosome biogenesis factor YjgA [Methylophaga lonarensis]EMR12318.1 hypothetical protein MPL1_10818 [Methylophaga lonarensis MPL]
MSEYEDFDDDLPIGKSKSQIKRELDQLKDLGRKLMSLGPNDLEKLDLPENIYEAVLKSHAMQKGALKRQTSYLGGLIAKSDWQAIQKNLQQLRQPERQKVEQFHQLEQWRDQLLAGDDSVFALLKAKFPEFDIQHVRQLQRNASRESAQNKPPKSARQLFRYLQQMQEAE